MANILLRPLLNLYPRTTPLYWSFLALNMSQQVGYMVRDSYRSEAVIPRHRYLDYSVKGIIGAIITTFAFEITNRVTEAFYKAPLIAKKALHLDQDLADLYIDPKTGQAAQNLKSLSRAPELLGRMSGSFAKNEANKELAQNLLGELLKNPDQFSPKTRPAIVHFWRRMQFFEAADENNAKQFDDFLKLVVDEKQHNKQLLKYFKPGTIGHLPTEHLNALRDALLQHQLTMKLLRDAYTKPNKKGGLDVQTKTHLLKTANFEEWLEKEQTISQHFKEGTTLNKADIPDIDWLKNTKLIEQFDKQLKDELNSFNYFVTAKVKEGAKEVERKIFNPHLAQNKLDNIKKVLAIVAKEVDNVKLGDHKLLITSEGFDNRLLNTLHETLERVKPSPEQQAWLRQYLQEGIKGFNAKKLLSRIDKHDFWLKLITCIGIQFFTYGMFTTYLDVDVAQPLQKRLTAEGIRVDKVSRWPIYSSLIPGVLAFIVASSDKIIGKLPGLGPAITRMPRLGRMIFSSVISSGVIAAYISGGINTNINRAQDKALKDHSAKKPLPSGYQEGGLLKLGYDQFSVKPPLNYFAGTPFPVAPAVPQAPQAQPVAHA